MDAWWRANNYLTIGQIYLQDNALLQRPLVPDDIKPRLLGHWGTSPGLSFVYAHMSRVIRHTGQETIYLTGPGHGGPALVAAGYLEGTYSEVYPKVTRDADGVRRLFRQFSAPGGIPSHVSVTTPGSIHEGGELGYVLFHAFGAVMDNPDLLALAVVGDGEAETGPLEGSWKGISFLNPRRDGAVLPGMHERFAQTLATAYDRIRGIQREARADGWTMGERPRWPLIVLRTPKGWTGPAEVDGVKVTGTWRSHQVPLSGVKDNPDHLALLEAWMRSYRPEELFDASGRPVDLVLQANPEGDLRMSASPHSNGGVLTTELDIPDFRDFARDVPSPAGTREESTRALGELMRELYVRNPTTFRLFSPDETNSNRVGAVFDV